MDPVNPISRPNTPTDSRQGNRTALNARRSEGVRDKVEVSARNQRAVPVTPAAPAFALHDEAAARGLAEKTMAQIVAMPALAARAQANGRAEGVLDTLR